VQRWFAKKYRTPWGISESGYSDTDASGNYLYHAFGIPDIALKYGAEAGLVISPYSSCLALEVDPSAALCNLKSLQKLGWLGSYGFYEAGDYRVSSASRRQPSCALVRSWMVHHQGMSLLAICNLLHGRVFQRWFHKSPMVQSTERLLHERPQVQTTD
jgi:cyclic beta-1,2-glucan synthetase